MIVHLKNFGDSKPVFRDEFISINTHIRKERIKLVS